MKLSKDKQSIEPDTEVQLCVSLLLMMLIFAEEKPKTNILMKFIISLKTNMCFMQC